MKGKKVIAMAVKRDNRQKMKTNKYQKKWKKMLYQDNFQITGIYWLASTAANKKA